MAQPLTATNSDDEEQIETVDLNEEPIDLDTDDRGRLPTWCAHI